MAWKWRQKKNDTFRGEKNRSFILIKTLNQAVYANIQLGH